MAGLQIDCQATGVAAIKSLCQLLTFFKKIPDPELWRLVEYLSLLHIAHIEVVIKIDVMRIESR